MRKTKNKRIKELIDRLGRIISADEWTEDINPTQWTALSYLAQANKFSRSPSQVADFMAATRGTVSQTLKTLARKELISEVRSELDRRSISYSVTAKGAELIQRTNTIETAASFLNNNTSTALIIGLETLMGSILKQRNLKGFGVCDTCRHHQKNSQGSFCNLLNQPLTPSESKQICHEHSKCS